MTDQQAADIAAEGFTVANVVPAGRIVIMHARWTYEHGPQECVGVFRATRDFDPVAEHALFAEAFPAYGSPSGWSEKDRNDFAYWAINGRGFLEDATPTFLFLEPWPEKPAAAEKVAHADR